MNRIEFVLVLLFTFFVIVVWITSDVILATPQTAEDPKVQKLPSMLEPLSPNFDTKTIEIINNQKLPVADTRTQTTEVPAPVPSPVASPSPGRATPIPRPTPSPRPSASPSSADLLFGTENNTANSDLTPSPSPIPSAST